MSETNANPRTSSHLVAYLLLGLAVIAVGLSAWDLVIEQDGEGMESVLTILIGLVVGAIGWQRLRAG